MSYSQIQKNETLESWHNEKDLNWKGHGTYPQSSKLRKRFLKIIAFVYIYQLVKFGELMSFGSKDIFKNVPYRMDRTSQFGKSWDG